MIYTILVTDVCNLKCSYCYEGENKNKEHMTIQTADEVIKFIKETSEASKKNSRIVFHGGEPFLNFNLIKYLKTKIDTEIPNSNNFIYEITTNGTLINNEIIEFVKENSIKLSISIDGSKESHNKYRIFHNDLGSYDIVIKNIKLLIENNITPRCRMTFSANTFKYIHKGVSELNNLGLNTFAISANFYDNTWTTKSINEFKLEVDKLIQTQKEKNIHISIVDKNQICKLQSDCFGGIASFAISPKGMIYPCIFNISDKKFIIGSVFDFDYEKITTKMYNFHKKISEHESICNECGAKELCKGSKCKLLNYMVNKSYSLPPIITCEMMKIELDTYKKL